MHPLTRVGFLVRAAGALLVLQLSLHAASAPAKGKLPFELPKAPEPAVQKLVERFVADYPRVSADAHFFDAPAGIAWPCEVSQEDQYRWFGAIMALPAEAKKSSKLIRKLMREMGQDPDSIPETEYKNIRIIPIRAQAKDGKLDGEAEVWTQYETFSETKTPITIGEKTTVNTTTTRMYYTQRVVHNFVDGEPKLVLNHALSEVKSESHSSDPALEKAMNKSKMPTGRPTLTITYADAPPITQVSFMVMEVPDVKGGMLGVSVKLKTQLMTVVNTDLGDGLMKMVSYTDRNVSTISQMKDGKMEGEQITYVDDFTKQYKMRLDQIPGMEQARIVVINGQSFIEQRNHYHDGVPVKTAAGAKP